jgi:hypothetical protein
MFLLHVSDVQHCDPQLSITNLLLYSTADLALIIPTTIPIWIICVAWTVQRIRNVHRFPKVQEELIASSI